MVAFEDELREINNYIRHVAQLLVAWYTFFIAANLVAAGWFASASSVAGNIGTRQARWTLCLVFIAVNALGLLACALVRRYFGQADARINEILVHPSKSPVPVHLFLHGALLIMFS